MSTSGEHPLHKDSDLSLSTRKYPLLEELSRLRRLPLRPTYTYKEAVEVLGGSVRALQERVRTGELIARDLPGRGRFFASDLEDFLQNSGKMQKRGRRNECQ